MSGTSNTAVVTPKPEENSAGIKRPWVDDSPTGFSPPNTKLHMESVTESNMDVPDVHGNVGETDDFFSKLSSPRVEAWLKKIIGEAIKAEVSTQTKKVEMLEAKVTQLETELTDIKSRLKTSDELQAKVYENERRIDDLERDLDELQQYGRRNALRIWSKDAESNEESTDDKIGRASCRERV